MASEHGLFVSTTTAFAAWALTVGLVACGDSTEKFQLTVTKAGAGSGALTAPDLSCGDGCTVDSARYDAGTEVEITATPDAGSRLAGWAGCDLEDGAKCTLTMNADRAVTATFVPDTGEVQLTVTKDGTGGGTVTGEGIACGTDCTGSYAPGTSVSLVAVAEAGGVFAGWTGCDTAVGGLCTLTMSADRTVVATFTAGAVVEVSTDITTPTTWTTGTTYHVTASIEVASTLTVQPGVLVKMDADTRLTVTGALLVDGLAAESRVVFTTAQTPEAGGAWDGIRLAGSGSTLQHCAILYAGANEHAALDIDEGVAATVRSCVFAHHRTPTAAITGTPALDASKAAAGTVIESNVFFDNRVPLTIDVAFSPGVNAFDNALAAPSAPQPNQYNGVFVEGCGHVATAITWPATGVPYVIGDPLSACNYVTVDNGGQLTLGSADAPVVVKHFAGGSIDVAGRIVPHAVFTSVKDDTRGGDTNGDGEASAPAPGDWRGLRLRQSGSTFDGVGIFYGGGFDASALALDDGVSATIVNSAFGHNQPETASIVAAPALDASDAAAATRIQHNVFFDNTVPLSMNADMGLDDSNDFAPVIDGAPVPNRYQGVVVRGCGRVTRAVTWSQVQVPFVIGDPQSSCNYVTVDAAGSLTLADGVVLKFFPSGSLDMQGVINANADTQIVFTSFSDDAWGGDTNADGAATAPAGGDWLGARVRKNGSRFGKVHFLYAGGATSGDDASALHVADGVSVSVTECVFAHARPSMDSIVAPPALDASEAGPTGTTLLGNRFFDNTVPLAIHADLSLDGSNRFTSGEASAPLPNRYPGVIVRGCSTTGRSVQWHLTEVPFVIGDPLSACQWIAVRPTGVLALGADVTLKFFEEGSLIVDAGATLSVNVGAYLTSIRDDHVNDTNGDEGATQPTSGDWLGVKRHVSGGEDVCDDGAHMHYHTPPVAGACAW